MAPREMLEKELEVYQANKAQLVEQFEGRFVLVKDDQIVDVFETRLDAIRQGYKRFGNTPFLVKQIVDVEIPLYFTSNLLGV